MTYTKSHVSVLLLRFVAHCNSHGRYVRITVSGYTATLPSPDYPNPCPEAGCSHFCLPLNATSTQCSCPPGSYLTGNGMTCVASSECWIHRRHCFSPHAVPLHAHSTSNRRGVCTHKNIYDPVEYTVCISIG